MPLPTLTPANVVTRLAELYALSNHDLNLQADAIELNFTAWITANFALTVDQTTYLAGMDALAIKNFGNNCALCFRNRLTITLVYDTPPPLSIGKWVEEKNNVTFKADSKGSTEVTGSLTFTMVYIF